MDCMLCLENDHKYVYKLNHGRELLICQECGVILYDVKTYWEDELLEMTRLIDLTKHVKKLELKRGNTNDKSKKLY